MLALLTSLGFWQMDRAAQKRAMLEQFERSSTDAPMGLNASIVGAPEFRYRQVIAQGGFLPDRQILLDNQVHHGRIGYDVFTPFRFEPNGKVILVNRGWVPLGESRATLPTIKVSDEPTTIRGLLNAPPGVGIRLGVDPAQSGRWPRVVQYIDFEELGTIMGLDLTPGVLLLDPLDPHGYQRDWEILPIGPERHIGYAVQWFALAVAVLIIAVFMNLQRAQSEDEND